MSIFRNINFLMPLLILAFAACGNGKRIQPTGDISLSGKPYASLSGACTTSTSGGIEGTCSIISLESLGGASSEKSFAVQFQLKEQGSIIFHTFANQTMQGVDINFQRSQNTLIVTATIAGKTNTYTNKFAGIDASLVLGFQIDIHNSEQPTHMLIWNASEAPNFSSTNALVNSVPTLSTPSNWGASQGSGSSFAITMQNALLINTVISGPKYDD